MKKASAKTAEEPAKVEEAKPAVEEQADEKKAE